MENKTSYDKSLESSIFQVDKGKKKGFKAFLNINSLPELFKCIKQELSPLERSCLIDYELQNHLIELCFIPNKFTKIRTIVEFALQEIRNNSKFWIPNSDIFSRITQINPELIASNNNLADEKKNSKNDNALEGIECYLKYKNQIDSIKADYEFIRQEENKIEEEQESLPQNNNELISENAEIVEEKNVQNQNENNEIYEKFIEFNDTQRLTRHQKKKLYDQPNVTSQEFNKYLSKKNQILKEKKESEIMNSIFMANRYMKYPKIEFQIFPYVFDYATSKQEVPLGEKDKFHLQNFILFLMLQEKKERKKVRFNQNLFAENQKEFFLQDAPKILEESEKEENGLTEFYNLCHSKGFLVENVFFNDHHIKEKQKNLLKNVLILCKIYLEMKKNEKNPDFLSNISLDSSEFLLYREILDNLESYENIEENLLKKSVLYYIQEIELKKFASEINLETLHQFLKLNENFKKNKEVMGSFSSHDKINEALQSYDEIINSPTMKKKRAYKFHSEERCEWSESIYKKFLEGLLKYYDHSINNRKIAKFIGSGISANQVKFIKGKYLRKLKKRSRVEKIVAKELLQNDINKFDMNIFDFLSQKQKNLNLSLI